MGEVIDEEVVAQRVLNVVARLKPSEPLASPSADGVKRQDHGLDDALKALDAVALEVDRRLQIAEGERAALVEAIGMICEGVIVAGPDGAVAESDLGRQWLADEDGNSMAGSALSDVLQTASSGRQTTRSLELLGPPRRSICVRGLPVLDGCKNPVGAVAVMEDTTERRHLEAVRRDFVANVSHELKTPVGALGLLAETLMVEKDPEVSERLIHRMHVETLRVGQVIDDLLNLSRIESLNNLSAETISAKSVVEQAVGRVRYAAEHRNIAIAVGGDGDTTLYGSQRELVSAIHHLLENALKYSSENSSVEVTLQADGDWTEVSVRDHGPGIAAQYLDRIFERFYRVDDARTRDEGGIGGTGLGLSIVRHVMQSHGGEVRVMSQEGDGSTFTLRLASKHSAATERLVVEDDANE